MRTIEFDDHLRLPGAALVFVAFDDADDADSTWMGPAEAAYARSLVHGRRRAAWLAGRFAAKTAIRRLSSPSVPLARIQVLPAAGGEPVVGGAASTGGIEVSIAHSGSVAAAVAFERRHTGAVGIDLEGCSRPLDPALIDFAFSPEEAGAIEAGVDAGDRHLRTLRFWTAKEAVLKAVRRGLRLPLSAVRLTWGDAGDGMGASVEWSPGASVPFVVRAADRPGHVVSVAIEADRAR